MNRKSIYLPVGMFVIFIIVFFVVYSTAQPYRARQQILHNQIQMNSLLLEVRNECSSTKTKL